MTILKIWQRIWRGSFQPFTIDNKYKLVPAFESAGHRFYMFEDPNAAPTGRMLAALAIYDEMSMRTSREYLQQHCAAVEKIVSDPRKINIGALAQLNKHLQERLELMALPEFVYKLASVIFLSEHENPYTYDFEFNQAKIKEWKAGGLELDFFLQTPLRVLIPELDKLPENASTFMGIAAAVDRIHRECLTGLLSAET